MRLKQVTTGLVIFGVLLLFGLPLVIGSNPQLDKSRPLVTKVVNGEEKPVREATRVEMAEYGVRLGLYIMAMFAVWIAVIICAMLIIRQVRKEVAEMSAAHMQAFVEGTLSDHAKRTGKDATPLVDLGEGDDDGASG